MKYKEQQNVVDGLKKSVEELGDKWYSVRSGMADLVTGMVTQGNTLKQIWSRLWGDLAKEAIYRLFQVQTQASLLGSIFGIFGIGGGTTATATKSTFNTSAVNNALLPTAFPHATGGIFDKEHLALLNEKNKKEAVIPLENNKERGKQLWWQSGVELGMIGGNGVVPYLKNPELANNSNINVQVQQSEKHIAELQKTNALLLDQNQILFEMLNKNGSNGTTVAQPIVVKESMTLDEFANMFYKARSFNYIR